MRALVTGASGFVGSHLVPHLVESGDRVVGTLLSHEDQKPACDCLTLDVTSLDNCVQVIKESNPEVVYHLAGIAFAPDAERNFDLAHIVNVGGVYNVFRACQELSQACKIVVISSSEVYGKITPDELPVSEDTPVRPPHNYSLSKIMAEFVAKRFDGTETPSHVVMRSFNHIGPGQRKDFVVSSFASQLADIAKGSKDPVMRVGNLDAERDFTDVRDIVRAYRLAALKGSGTLNLCSGKPVAVQYILDTLLSISGLDVDIQQDPERMRPSEIPQLYGSFARANQQLGWQAELPLEQSLKDAYEYWLNQ